jgi:phosphopentomutase
VDFDMLWGHRNDIQGFIDGLIIFDRWLDGYLEQLDKNDILFITSDHGNDPTTPSTDHSREYVPILIFGQNIKKGINIGTRDTFADLHTTIADYFNVKPGAHGRSFYDLIQK